MAFALARCSPYGGGAFTCTHGLAVRRGRHVREQLLRVHRRELPVGLRYGDSSGPNSGACVGRNRTRDDAAAPLAAMR